MNVIAYILRGAHATINSIKNKIRIGWLNAIYPGLTVSRNCVIESNCMIKCVKGGKMIIFDSTISYGSQIIADATGVIEIRNSFIGRNCVITAKQQILINSGCLLAEMVVLRDQNHMIDLVDGTGDRENFTMLPIHIEQNVWIGAKATILKGVSVGKYSVVAASSVITKNIPPMEVWGGVPGRFLKKVKNTVQSPLI